MYRQILVLVVCSVALSMAAVRAQEKCPKTWPNLPYNHIKCNDQGESYFVPQAELTFCSGQYVTNSCPLGISTQAWAGGMITFVETPIDWESTHPSPKPQWLVVLTGKVQVEVDTGPNKQRTFGPGAVFLLEDTEDKCKCPQGHTNCRSGHTSKALGEKTEPRLSFVAITLVGELKWDACRQ